MSWLKGRVVHRVPPRQTRRWQKREKRLKPQRRKALKHMSAPMKWVTSEMSVRQTMAVMINQSKRHQLLNPPSREPRRSMYGAMLSCGGQAPCGASDDVRDCLATFHGDV